MEFGLTGVLARCTGLKRDLRLSRSETYANYPSINFRSYIGQHGDCYDRFLIRMYEMIESLNIINQTIKKCETSNQKKQGGLVNSYEILNYISRASMDRRSYNKNLLMEDTIKDFKYWSENLFIEPNIICKTIESPKGEFGVTVLSDGSNMPYKVKVRSPAYHHMQLCPKISKGHFLADLVAIIGTVDIVFGEIDR
jgi:NADH:ubiquinone oxidoreductase subunit D